MSETDNTEAQERNTAATNRSSRALDTLTSAASRAAQITGILGELPTSMTDLLGTTNAATRGLAFFESRFAVLQQLTSFGVTFGYSLLEMESQANRAGYSLSDLANVVGQRSQDLAMLGAGVDAGLTNFLNRQASLFDAADAAANDYGLTMNQQLRAFGLTQAQINETMLDFDVLFQMGRRSQNRSDRERNQIAMEYFETLDDLSKLTGKQRDAIAEELAEVARRGQVQARAMLIDDDELRQDYREQLGAMRAQLGDTAGALAEDILGPGSPQSKASAEMSVAAYQYTELLYQARRHLDRGETELFNATMDRAAAAALAARNEDNANQALFRSRNSYGNTIADFFEGSYRFASTVEAAQAMIEEQTGESVSAQEAITRMRRDFDLQREARERAFAENSDPAAAIARGQEAAFTTAQTSRESALDTAYSNLGGIVRGVTGMFSQLSTAMQPLITAFGGNINALLNFDGTQISALAAQARQDALDLGTSEGVDLAAEIERIQDDLAGELPPGERTRLQNDLQELIQRAQNLRLENMVIGNVDNLTIEDIERINEAREAQGRDPLPTPDGPTSIGTLGTIGRLFKNFGTESLVPLHGFEAVLTPDQLGDVVNRSVGATLNAASSAFDDATPATSDPSPLLMSGMRVIEGRVNTLSNRLPQLAQSNAPDIDFTVLENAMAQLPQQLKRPFEEALASIGSEMANNGRILGEIAYNTERTTRNTKGMSGDFMRGA